MKPWPPNAASAGKPQSQYKHNEGKHLGPNADPLEPWQTSRYWRALDTTLILWSLDRPAGLQTSRFRRALDMSSIRGAMTMGVHLRPILEPVAYCSSTEESVRIQSLRYIILGTAAHSLQNCQPYMGWARRRHREELRRGG